MDSLRLLFESNVDLSGAAECFYCSGSLDEMGGCENPECTHASAFPKRCLRCNGPLDASGNCVEEFGD